MDLLLNIRRTLLGAGDYAAEFPEHSPPLQGVDRDVTHERAEW